MWCDGDEPWKKSVMEDHILLRFHFYEMSRAGKSMEVDRKLVVVWDWGNERKKGVDANGYGVFLGVGGCWQCPKIDYVGSASFPNVQKETLLNCML